MCCLLCIMIKRKKIKVVEPYLTIFTRKRQMKEKSFYWLTRWSKKIRRKLFKRERSRIFAFNVSCLRNAESSRNRILYNKNKTKVYKVTFHKQKGNEQEIYSIKTTTRWKRERENQMNFFVLLSVVKTLQNYTLYTHRRTFSLSRTYSYKRKLQRK